jgi:5-methylcytosine-specific restriction protein B
MLFELLLTRSATEFDPASVSGELAEIFPGTAWGTELRAVPYTPANASNLWSNELRPAVRHALEAGGKSAEDFATWLGGVHYTSAAAYSLRIFPDRYQSNEGWRILAMGFPAVGTVVAGLASHYQNAQDHNALSRVSRLLHERARNALQADGIALPGRSAVADDWDKGGLSGDVLSVAGMELGRDEALTLGDVRTTTVKKILASYFTIKVVSSNAELTSCLRELQIAAARLAGHP